MAADYEQKFMEAGAALYGERHATALEAAAEIEAAEADAKESTARP